MPAFDGVDDGEQALVRSWAGSDPGALRAVWDRYATLVHTFCVRALSDREAAADCTQETFVSAWRSRDRFDPDRGSLPAWLLGIARHRVHDVYRSQRRVLAQDAAVRSAEAVDDGSQVDRLVERLLVADALATLGDRPRRVVELAFYTGLSQREIADRLGLPLGTVKSDMRRALRRLRTVVEGGDLDA